MKITWQLELRPPRRAGGSASFSFMKNCRSITSFRFPRGLRGGLALAGLLTLPGLAAAAAVTAKSALFTVDTRGRLFAEWAAVAGVPGGVLSGAHGPSGQPLLMAYALGWSPAGAADFAARLPRQGPGVAGGAGPVLTFVRPGLAALEVSLIVEESGDLKTWGELCRRDGAGVWTGPAVVTEETLPDGAVRVAVARAPGAGPGIRWFRLRVQVR